MLEPCAGIDSCQTVWITNKWGNGHLSHHLPLTTNLPHLLLSASEKLGTQP